LADHCARLQIIFTYLLTYRNLDAGLRVTCYYYYNYQAATVTETLQDVVVVIRKKVMHGFLSNKSCLTNLLQFLEYVTDAVDHGKPVDVIYFDFQKAFDKVPHQRILAKLKAHGISGRILNWIGEWLIGFKWYYVILAVRYKWSGTRIYIGSLIVPYIY